MTAGRLLRLRGWGLPTAPPGGTVITVFDTETGQYLAGTVDERHLATSYAAEMVDNMYARLEGRLLHPPMDPVLNEARRDAMRTYQGGLRPGDLDRFWELLGQTTTPEECRALAAQANRAAGFPL